MGSTVLTELVAVLAADRTTDHFEEVSVAAAAAIDLHARGPRERIAVHAGPAGEVGRRARHLRDAANPGQIVLSASARWLLADATPPGWVVRDTPASIACPISLLPSGSSSCAPRTGNPARYRCTRWTDTPTTCRSI